MKKFFALPLTLGLLALPFAAQAHTPLFSCVDNGDGTLFCEGGFSDGSSAAGTAIVVKNGDGKEVQRLALSRTSDIEFKKPEGAYSVVFDAGEGHQIEIKGSEIFE